VAGDVVLVSSAAPGSVGDVVIYHASFREAPGEGGRGIGFNGQLIDRVLAGPGDRVVCRGGAMTVNGRITAAHWLNSTYRPANLDLVVPDGSLFILPSNLPDRVSRLRQRGDGLGEISLVPQQRVSGVVWARVSPWSRRGRI
jgi:signal peptidase I